MSRINLSPLTTWITEAAILHGDDLPSQLMLRLDVGRRRALVLLHKLEAAQWLQATGTARRPGWRPGPLRQVVHRYALEGLLEDLPWRRDFAPCFELPPAIERMVGHAYTELLNNAVDHSGGTVVTVSMRQTPLQVQLLVSDNGIGAFQRIGRSFDIDDPLLAMLELSKGKLTSAPERHSGHGLFFTCRLADVFDLHANGSAFQCRDWEGRRWRSGRPATQGGTSIYLSIALDTARTLGSVLCEHSIDGGCGFDRTVVPLHLLAGPGASLASRADAKRVVRRLSDFRRADIDFGGITDIGHGFADELFRVFRRQHPALDLVPVGMAPQVAAMVASVAP